MAKMALILPKGIVVNSPGLSDNFMRRATKPLSSDEVLKMWKVYTTTQRRLKDPTAERLENLFWRMLGSKQRQLSSIVVAQMFANISKGITHPAIGPLRSSVPRDESGVPRRTAQLIPGDVVTIRSSPQPTQSSLKPPKSSLGSRNTHSKKAAAQETKAQSSSTPEQSGPPASNEAVAVGYTCNVLSSSTKREVPMPPPILKKPRGQSSTGPKPTARFVSPAVSEDEDAVEGEHEESVNSHVTVRPPTPPLEGVEPRTAPLPRKKLHGHVRPTMGRKKRPIAGRQPSSQSSNGSTGSENSAHSAQRTELMDEASAKSEVLPRSEEILPADSVEREKPRVHDSTRSAPENKHITKTASRSRAVRPRSGRTNSGKTLVPVGSNRKGKERAVDESGERGSSSKLRAIENQHDGCSEDEEVVDDDQIEEIRLKEHFLEEGRKALEAKKKIEDDALEEQSHKLSSSSRKSSSAHNLSAAYRGSRLSGFGNVSKAPAAVAAAPLDPAADVSDESRGTSIACESVLDKEKDMKSAARPLPLPRRSLVSEPLMMASCSGRQAIASSLGNVAPIRSVSNLTALLQKDDEKKKAKNSKNSSG